MTSVYDFLAPVLGIGNALALLTVLVFILRGPAKKYWVIVLYVCWELLATAGLTVADILLNGTTQTPGIEQARAAQRYAGLYWENEVIVDLLRFLVVIVLIYKSMSESNSRVTIQRILTGVVGLALILPFLLFHPAFTGRAGTIWYNSTSQLLNFGAAIMNLVLWAILIPSKRRDPQLVLVSIGLGIVVAGTAVVYGLRHFAPQGGFTAVLNLFLNLTQLCGWAIWCRAFRPARKVPGPPASVPTV
jgi:hypothetical protein